MNNAGYVIALQCHNGNSRLMQQALLSSLKDGIVSFLFSLLLGLRWFLRFEDSERCIGVRQDADESGIIYLYINKD